MAFQKATKKQARLRLAIEGASGSGKTYSALQIAKNLNVGRIAVIDTEHGSASKYADLFEFDVLNLDDYAPQNYIEALKEAELGGYGIVIIDSLSHAWAGKGGVLEIVEAKKRTSGNKMEFAAWGDGTKQQNLLIDAILACPLHIIATMRTKAEYALDERNKPKKIGTAPIQREGVDYEFDIVGSINYEHSMEITKTRAVALTDKVFEKPGADFAKVLKAWLADGEAEPAPFPPEVVRDAVDQVKAAPDTASLTAIWDEMNPELREYIKHAFTQRKLAFAK